MDWTIVGGEFLSGFFEFLMAIVFLVLFLNSAKPSICKVAGYNRVTCPEIAELEQVKNHYLDSFDQVAEKYDVKYIDALDGKEKAI